MVIDDDVVVIDDDDDVEVIDDDDGADDDEEVEGLEIDEPGGGEETRCDGCLFLPSVGQ
jgi:hypothetical protein